MLRTLLIAFAVDLVLYVGFVTARYGLGLVAHARSAALEDRADA
jgi:hypothetical protein